MNDEVVAVQDERDPVAKARRATDLLTSYQGVITELSRVRREAVEELIANGMTHADIARILGTSRGRVSQLVTSGPPPERLFLGTDTLTVALGGKLESGKEAPGSVVAQEDLDNFEQLRSLAASMKLEARYEVIPPPGTVRLNRDNLIVVCGPRLSPLIAQVLEADDHLRFEKDSAWHLIDVGAAQEHRSPMDTGVSGDVGYLARLPRPDGKGTFLYIAGIHAIGANGVIHYLKENLAEVYGEVRTRRFSTLVACDFDPETRQILGSRRVAPFYKHEGN